IDPMTAFTAAGINLASDAEVRRVLAPLADLAAQRGCVIILVRHLSKESGGRALYRGLHSIGFIAASRVGYFAGPDPKLPGRRVLAQCANNFARSPRASPTASSATNRARPCSPGTARATGAPTTSCSAAARAPAS